MGSATLRAPRAPLDPVTPVFLYWSPRRADYTVKGGSLDTTCKGGSIGTAGESLPSLLAAAAQRRRSEA